MWVMAHKVFKPMESFLIRGPLKAKRGAGLFVGVDNRRDDVLRVTGLGKGNFKGRAR